MFMPKPFWGGQQSYPRKALRRYRFSCFAGTCAVGEKKPQPGNLIIRFPGWGFPSLAGHGRGLFLESGYDVFDEKLE